jgi:hypothetical protein
MQSEKLQAKLRKIILENEGDRGNIYSEILEFVKPFIDGLTDIAEPSGAYSRDPLTHANNTIENVKSIASGLLDYEVEGYTLSSTGWHSVEDRPLFTKDERGNRVCTEDKEFIAALEINKRWWIRHCVVDETGLCVVGDDNNEPAGWNLEDVTHWMPMPSPPTCR